MQNRPPLILKPQDVNQPPQKYKFWDTSITGNQRSPKNMSLVTSSDFTVQQQNQGETVLINSQEVINNELDSEQNSVDNTVKRQTQKIQSLQEDIQNLRAKIQEHRILNSNLVKQLNKTTNQLRVIAAMNQQLDAQCDKLYSDVKASHDRHSEVVNQKMELIIQISRLNQQKELAMSKCQICEQQVQFLNRKVQTLHEQISFQKSIASDLNKQTIILKQQLNKIMLIMQDYSQLQQQVYRTKTINHQIQKRVQILQQQLKQTRIKVAQSQINQQKYMQDQNKLFLRIQQLENNIKIYNYKLYLAQSEISLKNQQLQAQGKNIDYQSKYVKILQEYQRRNQDLVFEIMALTQRNHILLEQKDFYQRRVQATITNRNQRLPYDHFVSLLRAGNSDIQTLKRKLQNKQDQLQQFKHQFQQQNIVLRQKIQELTNIVQIREKQIDNKQLMLKNQINIYRKQCQLMVRRNQELKSVQVKLRLEIMQKDRIIVEYIQSKKAQQQKRNQLLTEQQDKQKLAA